ncbi:MAG: tRNA pseudouridine(55) synthase TruB [Pseudomonadota bacterium]
MARRRKGRPVHGWLIVDKSAGPSSADVVAIARRALGAQKAGHAGTLDPAATGLLAVAFGEATKTIPWLAKAEKAYRFTVRWGAATDTDDAEGTVTARAEARPEAEAIVAALPAFRGDILQTPPQVSAVKVDGQRAYHRARAGEEVALAPRPLHVSRLELIEMPDRDTAVFEMVCGKGGYVRAIARDLGAALGCLGHVLTLRRIWSGPFDLSDAVPLAELEAPAAPEAHDARLLPVEAALAALPRVTATPEGAVRIANGNPGAILPAALDWGTEGWAEAEGRPLAIGTVRAGLFHPERVFRF